MTENPERRQSPRKRPEQLVYVEFERDNGGMMLNVSEEGFCFRAVSPVRQEGKIGFAFAIDRTRQLQGHGELEWTDEGGKVGGLGFSEVSQNFREEIRRWLRESRAPVDSGKKSVRVVAPPVDPLDKHLWDVKVEPRKSLPPTHKVEDPEIAGESFPAIEQPAINTLRQETKTAILPAPEKEVDARVVPEEPQQSAMKISPEETNTGSPPEQAPLKVGGESTTAPATQKEADLPSSPAMRIGREEHEITISLETAPDKLVRNDPERTEPLPNVGVPAASEEVEEPKAFGEPAGREQEERLEQLKGPVGARKVSSARLNRAAAVGIVVIGLTVVFLAVVFSFRHDIGESLIWLGEKMSAESRQAEPETREAPTNVSTILPSEPPAAGSPAEPIGKRLAPVRAEPSAPVSNSNVATPINAEEEPGQAELAVAERILASKNGARDITGAVKLLWTSVQKGNSAAVLTLSELYLRGEVIRKNCAQARELLTTAAKKGDAGAKAKLQQLGKEGCR